MALRQRVPKEIKKTAPSYCTVGRFFLLTDLGRKLRFETYQPLLLTIFIARCPITLAVPIAMILHAKSAHITL